MPPLDPRAARRLARRLRIGAWCAIGAGVACCVAGYLRGLGGHDRAVWGWVATALLWPGLAASHAARWLEVRGDAR
jgi:hypothetical protein